MSKPPVYLDECVDNHLTEALRVRGFVVASAVDLGLRQIDDDVHLDFATARGWLCLSHNRRDFEFHHRRYGAQGGHHSGILILPQTSPLPQLIIRAAMMLDWVAELPDPHNQLFLWGRFQSLLIGGHRVPGYTEAEVRLALGWRP